MDRRKSIKALLIGTASTGVLLNACKNTGEKSDGTVPADPYAGVDRMAEEKEHLKKIMADTFFTPHEMATIAILADIIIPKDEVSGSATDAKVPDFIEFIVKDQPGHQVPMRGGLRWLDMQCLRRFDKSFRDCNEKERMEIVDEIAWPAKAKPEMAQGVAFFNRMRNLTASGFYTTEMGVKDIGYVGNRPNQWNGVPDAVLKKHGLAYTDKELKECVSFDKA